MWFIETDKATKETDDCESPAMNSVLDDLKVLLLKKKKTTMLYHGKDKALSGTLILHEKGGYFYTKLCQ